MRLGRAERKTRETKVSAEVNLDGSGRAEVETRVGYLDHLIVLLSAHSLFDVKIQGKGDLIHHVIEDVALCLGEAFRKALGDRSGIVRFGSAITPMEDALAYVGVDLARRPYSVVDLKIEKDDIEGLPREDIYHFVRSLVSSMEATVHMVVEYGENDHHKAEAALKALALSLREAVSIDPLRKGPPSSKGVM